MLTTYPPSVLGAQRPRLSSVPAYTRSDGDLAVELAAAQGLVLDDWQRWFLEQAMGIRDDGSWAALSVLLLVPRQNGKGSILEARELAGLFLLEEELLLHSAHEFKTCGEAFRRLWSLIRDSELEGSVKNAYFANGKEAIELYSGQRIKFVARSAGSGRGFTGDLVVLDEAYALTDTHMTAITSTLSARPNPQIWFTSSAGQVTSIVLERLNERGMAGTDPRMLFANWSADPAMDLESLEALVMANPAWGIRLNEDVIAFERESFSVDGFRRERLGLFSTDTIDRVIPGDVWAKVKIPTAPEYVPTHFALDIPPDRSWSSIAVANGTYGELVAHDRGMPWVVDRIIELSEKWKLPVVIDTAGPAGTLIEPLEARRIEVIPYGERPFINACQSFYDRCVNGELRVLYHPALDEAVSGAAKKPVGDAWKYTRLKSESVISPLVAVTLAVDAANLADKRPVPWVM